MYGVGVCVFVLQRFAHQHAASGTRILRKKVLRLKAESCRPNEGMFWNHDPLTMSSCTNVKGTLHTPLEIVFLPSPPPPRPRYRRNPPPTPSKNPTFEISLNPKPKTSHSEAEARCFSAPRCSWCLQAILGIRGFRLHVRFRV